MSGAAARTLHLVVPGGIDDPRRPSGGNRYDRRVAAELTRAGWQVVEHPVEGAWPDPGFAALARLHNVLLGLSDGAPVLLDGLVGSAAPDVVGPAAARLRVFPLIHLPLIGEGEGQVLRQAAGIVVTSDWTRRRLVEAYALGPDRITVAEPGADAADPAARSAAGTGLLCVAAVCRPKGHDVLLAALEQVGDLPWHCRWVGSLDREPGFVATLVERVRAGGLDGRVELSGPLTGRGLGEAYARADLVVLASRGETYGMVVTEALARGIPVLASDVGGVPEALGRTPAGPPGLLLPAGDPGAWAAGLRDWLTRPELRARLRTAADLRRGGLAGWSETAVRVAGMITGSVRSRGAA